MARELIHTGRRIKVYVDTLQTAQGPVRRDLIEHPGAVVILPLLNDETICLLRNHRFVVGETLWEIPAGTLEPGEELLAAAQRELAEETGYTAKRWHPHGYFFASPGVLNEKLHLFFARDLTLGKSRPEADEQLEPVTIALADAIKLIMTGQIQDAKTITAILLWDRLRSTPEALKNSL